MRHRITHGTNGDSLGYFPRPVWKTEQRPIQSLCMVSRISLTDEDGPGMGGIEFLIKGGTVHLTQTIHDSRGQHLFYISSNVYVPVQKAV